VTKPINRRIINKVNLDTNHGQMFINGGDVYQTTHANTLPDAGRVREKVATHTTQPGQESVGGDHDLFLCYNSVDAPAVRYVYNQLCKSGIRPWFDEKDLRAGQSWHDVLEQQLSLVPCVAVLIGQEGLGDWQREEYKAFWHQASRHDKGLIPVVLNTTVGDPVLPPLLQDRIRVDLRGDWTAGFDKLVAAIRSFSPGSDNGRD
jgi:hypothetical protein